MLLRSTLLLLLVVLSVSAADDDMTINVSVIGNNELDDSANQKASGEMYEKADDLCSSIKCGLGEQCVINENEAVCQCSDSCEIPSDERQMVCSSSNKTYQSDCHFLREKCWCGRKDSRCTDLSVLNEKLDYYGQCKDIEECTLEQRKVFPVRMKIWLDEVLHILNKRNDLDSKYLNLVKLADEMKSNNAEKYWTAGVAFEFCQLDKSQDHQIQKEELGSLISSIKALENCIQPFLDECDTDGNDLISDAEWGKCLDLSDSDLVILRKNC